MTCWVSLIEDFLADQADIAVITENWYRARLRPFGEFLATEWGISEPGQIEARHVNRYLKRLLRAGLSWSTRNGTYTALGRWFGWFQQRRLIETNPFQEPKMHGLKRPKKTRRVVADVPMSYVRRMIEAAEAEAASPPSGSPRPPSISPQRGEGQRGEGQRLLAARDAALMRLLISTGMRRHEAVGLDLADLDLEAGDIRVITGKGGHERVGVLTPETVAALKRWLAARPETECLAVFVSLQPNKKGLGCRLRPDAVNDVLIKWRDRAGLPAESVSPHKWRHAFGTAVGRAKNLFVLQELMGHADISTTRIYVRTDRETMREMVEEYGPAIDL